MASCGISVNLNALEASISSHISLIAGKSSLMGKPWVPVAVVAALAISKGNLLGAITAVVNVEALAGVAWKGLRSGLGDLVDAASDAGITVLTDEVMEKSLGIITTGNLAAPLGSALRHGADILSPGDVGFIGPLEATFGEQLLQTVNDFGGDITKFAKTSGLSNLSGYVDIDVLDLAKSSIGLGASFNECDFGVSGIRNFYRDPVSGGVKLLANYAPKIGDTILASGLSSYGMGAQAYLNFKSGKASSILNINLNSIASSVGDYALDRIGESISSSTDLKVISDNIKESITPSQSLFQKKTSTGETMLVDENKEAEDLYQDVYDSILGE
jgi:hypothetical protein